MIIEIIRKQTGSHGTCTTARLTEEINSNDSSKLDEMKNLMEKFMPSADEEVHCSAKSPMQKNKHADQPISEKQLNFFEVLLKKENISPKDFCAQHGIDSIKDLSMTDARVLIKELKDQSKSGSEYF